VAAPAPADQLTAVASEGLDDGDIDGASGAVVDSPAPAPATAPRPATRAPARGAANPKPRTNRGRKRR
jgi:hypothetical protein